MGSVADAGCADRSMGAWMWWSEIVLWQIASPVGLWLVEGCWWDDR
jgi:hypothetical protein